MNDKSLTKLILCLSIMGFAQVFFMTPNLIAEEHHSRQLIDRREIVNQVAMPAAEAAIEEVTTSSVLSSIDLQGVGKALKPHEKEIGAWCHLMGAIACLPYCIAEYGEDYDWCLEGTWFEDGCLEIVDDYCDDPLQDL